MKLSRTERINPVLLRELYAKHRKQSGDQSFFLAFSSGAFLEQFGVETIPRDFALGAGGFSADPDKKKAAADEAGFTTIFNGKTLDQWAARVSGRLWMVPSLVRDWK